MPTSRTAKLGRSSAVASLFLVGLLAVSSLATAADSSMPKDGKALFRLAAKSNNIADPDLRPWHLKASYTLFDATGNPSSQGTFEEWWVGPQKIKTQYESSSFAQTDYLTEKGRYRSGSQTAPAMPLSWLGSQLTEPVAVNEEQIKVLIVDREVRKKGGVEFVCLRESGMQTPGGVRRFAGLGFCLESDRPVLVSSDSLLPAPLQFGRGNVKSFQGRYVPFSLVAVQNGKKIMEAQIQMLEELNGVDEAAFTPPSDALPVALRVHVSADIAASMLVKKTQPKYPAGAQSAGASGTVSLQAVIGRDGHIVSLHVISGPTELQQAAIDSVQTWVYKPYLLNNVPVEVNTTINVIFKPHR